jgi:predicted AAA+ superfamily ATPase
MKSRNLIEFIEQDLANRWISVILGPRQVGKTTLLKQLHKKTGGLFLDLDIYSNFEKVSSYENFLRTLELNSYKKDQKGFFYVYLDEFQRYTDLTKVLKNIYDHHDNIKILITGSSSLTIKNQIQESLAGRKRVFEMYPLSFEEFLDFKDRNDLLEVLKNTRNMHQVSNLMTLAPELYLQLEEFMIYGGYPRVVLSPKADKKLVLESIFDSYIKKDLVDYLKLEKISNAKTLMELLAINHGSITNYNNYASIAGIDAVTVKNYIEILNETFITMNLRPFFKNKNKEISKNPKVYFIDSGARNYLINNFNPMDIRDDAAFLFESFVISEFLKSGLSVDSLKFYRTYTKVEVDLIIDLIHKQIPVEIKYKANCKKKDFSGLIQFIKEYNPTEAYMINLGQIGEVDIVVNYPQVKYLSCFDTLSIKSY